jgi:hypothetical protein
VVQSSRTLRESDFFNCPSATYSLDTRAYSYGNEITIKPNIVAQENQLLAGIFAYDWPGWVFAAESAKIKVLWIVCLNPNNYALFKSVLRHNNTATLFFIKSMPSTLPAVHLACLGGIPTTRMHYDITALCTNVHVILSDWRKGRLRNKDWLVHCQKLNHWELGGASNLSASILILTKSPKIF